MKRKILVDPSPKGLSWIEDNIYAITRVRGRNLGRGPLLAAVAAAMAEARVDLSLCRSEAHVTATLVDLLTRGTTGVSNG